jgi:aspartyl/glutamyl-tRNA(Asn/Gln) amidotransferase C subunit
MTKEDIKILLDDLYLEADDEELEFINKEFMNLFKALQYFDAIDTAGVKESSWPFKIMNTYLREDEINHTLDVKDALKNAEVVTNDYVKYVKVVS